MSVKLSKFTEIFNSLQLTKNADDYPVRLHLQPFDRTVSLVNNIYLSHSEQSLYIQANLESDPFWQRINDLYYSEKAIEDAKALLEKKGYTVVRNER